MARKEKIFNYIYKTTCNVTGRYYIGMHSTDKLDDGYMGSGKRLWFSINYHGKHNHTKEILEYCNSRVELKEREKDIVNEELLNENLCMNLKTGGDGGLVDERHKKVFTDAGKQNLIKTKEQREMSLAKVRKNKKYKEGMSKSLINFFKTNEGNFKNKTHSDETKKLISEKRKGTGIGETNSQYGTCWITRDGANKKIKKENLETYLNEGWVKGRK